MREWLEAHKPAASRRVHVLLAALMWSVVGAVLLACGARWVLVSGGPEALPLVLLAVALGFFKSRLALDRAAERIVVRISTHDDRRCIGGFLSWRTWGLVAVMVVSGRVLRTYLLAPIVAGLVYTAVGSALVIGSRALWRGYLREPMP